MIPDAIQSFLDDPGNPAKLRAALSVGDCALLRWAVKFQRAQQPAEFNLLTVDACSKFANLNSARLNARINLIKAVLEDGNVMDFFWQAVEATKEEWGGQPSAGRHVHLNEEDVPSAMHPLRRQASGLAAQIEAEIQDPGDWLDPGLLMACETLAAFYTDTRKVELEVETKLLLATKIDGESKPIIAKLRLQRVDQGCGLLVPDPFRCNYLQMEPDFAAGLQHALWAARLYIEKEFATAAHNQDWRWSIDLQSLHQLLGNSPSEFALQGPSAEVAIACAMIASHADNPDNRDGDPLDPWVAVSARLDSPGQDGTPIAVGGVSDIDVKTLKDELHVKRLTEVVVAKTQDASVVPKEDKRFEFPEVTDLGRAYQRLVRNRRITRAVNRALQDSAGKILAERCHPYIRNGLESRVQSEHSTEPIEALASRWERLEEADVNRIVLGLDDVVRQSGSQSQSPLQRNAAQRVWIEGNSGMGKSMFLVHCQQQIAASSPDVVPLRLGRTLNSDPSLHDYAWNRPKSLIDELPGMSFLTAAFREAEKSLRLELPLKDRLDWFDSLTRRGCVVLLLDALDQTSPSHLQHLGQALESAYFQHCPVILTGRPEAASILADKTQSDWRRLRIASFDWQEQREYLGTELADLLQLDEEKARAHGPIFDWEKDEIRKWQIRELLGSPLLLDLLKRLAERHGTSLWKSLRNRKDIYELAFSELFSKGSGTVDHTNRSLAATDVETRKLLGKIAFLMTRRKSSDQPPEHNFENLARGDYIHQMLGSHRRKTADQLLEELKQIDLVTQGELLEGPSRQSIAFRHRSFLEFFAGLFLVGGETVEKDFEAVHQPFVPDQLRRTVVGEIHDLLDDEGNWLPDVDEIRLRPKEWGDTLRFALQHASLPQGNELALALVGLGNPWTVYESLIYDGIELDPNLIRLICWLVHQSWTVDLDARDALSFAESRGVGPPDEIRDKAAAYLDTNDPLRSSLIQRNHREGATLSAVRRLFPSASSLYAGESKDSSLLNRLQEITYPDTNRRILDAFVPVQAGVFDVSNYQYQGEVPSSQIDIGAFELADFPVTNELFELFCPTHRRQRDESSRGDDQPALYINFWMAEEFCDWISEMLGHEYRLPTEWEWEWACRWHNTIDTEYWWGSTMDDRLCRYGWFGDRTEARWGTRTRQSTVTSYQEADSWHESRRLGETGLLDMLGNVWEWTSSPWSHDSDPGSSRVVRGGSWLDDANDVGCSIRFYFTPEDRNHYVGFRLSRVV